EGYRAVASYDRQDWFRVDTSYADGVLTIRHAPQADQVYFAYFAPYSRERHADFVAECAARPGVTLEVLGATLDGQDLDCLR
ncbi:M14-type cytosolic carboxypeptidase, partial [Acinetobacter baumannii]